MNRKYIDGKTVLVFIKRVNHPTTPETAFKVIACLDSNSFSGTKELKEVNNKCTQGWRDGLAGNGSWQIPLSGQAIEGTDLQASEKNFDEMAEIWAAGEIFEVKMANADGSYYRAGMGAFTDWEEEANSDDPLNFSGTIAGLGAPVMTNPTPTP